MRALMLLASVFLAVPATAVELVDYLPEAATYDPSVPKPSDLLGFEVGEWHVRHDQLVSYMEALANASPRVSLEETGRTHEGRRLLLLAISSPANIADLDAVRRRHLDESETGKPGDGPLVVWQGFSVHGNEASGSNASMLLAYHLAAAHGDVESFLENTVILIDPSINPDGLGRFAQWANGHRSRTPVADPNNREHNEAWPNGRTNHYWFDLNRDWLLLTHPESRARVAQFHRWRPHVLTDFHEMGSNSTYYFQPGVPERRNPWTPLRNEELTREIARFHARAMDRAGRLYYSEETFDDFYYGKGSTYPDVNGSIGILFEQASARGHLMKTVHGELTFPMAIGNQLRTALSTMEAADALRDELRAFQSAFWVEAKREGAKDPGRAYVIGDAGDPGRTYRLLDILMRHQIEVHELAKTVEANGVTYDPGAAWIISLDQRQYRLIRSLMEYRTSFEDETFYDVSAWTLPAAFNLPFAELGSAFDKSVVGPALTSAPRLIGRFAAHPDAMAYAFEWTGYYAPRALQRLLAGKFGVYAATKPTTVTTPDGRVHLDRGSIVIPLGVQARPMPASPGSSAAMRPPDDRRSELEELLERIAGEDGITVLPLMSGMTPEGVDLGSPTMRRLKPVRPLLVVGRGVNGYEAGEVWHLLDTRVDLPLTMVEAERFQGIDLREYSHVILVDGDYKKRSEKWTTHLKSWVKSGGVLIATKRGAEWVTKQGLQTAPDDDDSVAEARDSGSGSSADEGRADTADATAADQTEDGENARPEDRYRPYGEFKDDRAKRVVGGSIFEIELDTTHPIGYGYGSSRLPVFRNSTLVLEPSDNPYETLARYSDTPLLGGYASADRQEQIAGTAAVIASRVGRGVVIRMIDNPNFRGVWYGTNKLFLNSLFFGRLIDATKIED